MTVESTCDAPWEEVLVWLRNSWVGVNAMWSEHFGIEYQAAGVVNVVRDSGGSKVDIVIEGTGFHATTKKDCRGFRQDFDMGPEDTMWERREVYSKGVVEK